MKLLLDANGNAVLRDGKPVYVKDDGTEIVFDGAEAFSKISTLTQEAAGHRRAKEKAEGDLKKFEGIADPAAAIAALATVSNLDQSKLIDAGKVETIKNEAIKATRAEYEPVVAERDKFKGMLNGAVIGGAFARSKFIAEKGAMPADMFQAKFGAHFELDESGAIVAKDTKGNAIYSPTRAGEVADFDEALSVIVGQYAYKDNILKGTGASGSGATQSKGQSGKPTITRSELEKLDPADRMAKLKTMELVEG